MCYWSCCALTLMPLVVVTICKHKKIGKNLLLMSASNEELCTYVCLSVCMLVMHCNCARTRTTNKQCENNNNNKLKGKKVNKHSCNAISWDPQAAAL